VLSYAHFRTLVLVWEDTGHETIVKRRRALFYRHIVSCIAGGLKRYGCVANRNRLGQPARDHGRIAGAGG